MRYILILGLYSVSVFCALFAYALENGEYINTPEVGFFNKNREMEFKDVTDTLNINIHGDEMYFDINVISPNFHYFLK